MPKIDGEHTDMTWIRVDSLIQFLLQNQSYLESKRRHELVDKIKKDWNIEVRQADYYIALAKKEIRAMSRKNSKRHFDRAVRDRNALLLQCKSDDINLKLKIMQDRDKLLDCYPEQKVKADSTNKNIDIDNLTTDALLRLSNGEDADKVLSDPKSYLNG